MCGVGLGVPACEPFQHLDVEDRVETQTGGEGPHGLVLAHRGAVGQPDVSDGAPEPGGQGEARAVVVPPQGDHRPGGTHRECGGPAADDPVDRLRTSLRRGAGGRRAVRAPGLSLGDEHAPAVPGRDERHALLKEMGHGPYGLGVGPAQQQGTHGCRGHASHARAIPPSADHSHHRDPLPRASIRFPLDFPHPRYIVLERDAICCVVPFSGRSDPCPSRRGPSPSPGSSRSTNP